MSADGQGTKCRRNIEEKFQLPEYGARALQTTDDKQTDRQTDRQTDGRQQIANVNVSSRSLREREFTFANKTIKFFKIIYFNMEPRL